MFTPKELILRPKPVPLRDFNLNEFPTRIIACPNPPVEAIQAGHAIAISETTFNIQTILRQLPFQPDLVSLSARVMTFLPQGLHKLNCPTVMKLGDTFHLGDGGLSRMVSYCKKLNCDYHWTYQSQQHLHFFAEAGLKNVFWLPASIVIESYIPKLSEKQYKIIFRGSESELHQYRTYVLNQLRNTEIDICQKDYISCLEDYAKAQIVINTSLNGDLNRRVFEVLMAGGFLLTDRVSPESGLFDLFEEGKHLECYSNETELIEKIQYYLAHPEKAAQIATAGQQHFLKHYSQEAIQQKRYQSIFQQVEPLKCDRRIQTSQNLPTRLKVYEFVQELHRLYPKLRIWCDDSAIASDLADLPRAQVQSSLECQIMILDGSKHAFKQHLQERIRKLSDRGFLLILHPQFFAIPQLNQWLKQYQCVPVKPSIRLFNQEYELTLEQHGIIYQKIIPRDYSTLLQNKTDLTLTQIDLDNIIRTQLKTVPLIRSMLYPIRMLKSWLR